jgi:2-keto-4-pentenoate hydratase/2-oxohepta-3-ene-1,7-dioic acid hydratase in catechol pathway
LLVKSVTTIKEDEMKFARFGYQGKTYTGTVDGEMVRVIEGSLFERYEETGTHYPMSDVKLLPPVVPTKVVCVGQNYLEHIEELGVPVPEEPVVFLKPPSCLIGSGDNIVYPRSAQRVDYEGELAVVIKDTMKDVAESSAMDYVLGYSCFNDVTERALVSKDVVLLALAKGFDTFGPFGPYLVTDLDPNNLEVQTYLNAKVMQHDNTRNCVFSVQKVLSFVSERITLYPRDVVITGTPKGIAPMNPGDTVEVEIEGIGRLRNVVKAETVKN